MNGWNPDYRSAALGYCFGDAAWGHGYATEAAFALLQWAFDTLDLNRVQAETERSASGTPTYARLRAERDGHGQVPDLAKTGPNGRHGPPTF